ncbi:hypothetical protein [Vibrio phage BONAISHI]|nr:hypothetical protein [Vibrio phage BONAISHI]
MKKLLLTVNDVYRHINKLNLPKELQVAARTFYFLSEEISMDYIAGRVDFRVVAYERNDAIGFAIIHKDDFHGNYRFNKIYNNFLDIKLDGVYAMAQGKAFPRISIDAWKGMSAFRWSDIFSQALANRKHHMKGKEVFKKII